MLFDKKAKATTNGLLDLLKAPSSDPNLKLLYRELGLDSSFKMLDKKPEAVDKIIADVEQRGVALSALYRRAYVEHAFGGGVTRHLILVRHGQYDEQRDLARPLEKERDFGMPLDEVWPSVDARQIPGGRTDRGEGLRARVGASRRVTSSRGSGINGCEWGCERMLHRHGHALRERATWGTRKACTNTVAHTSVAVMVLGGSGWGAHVVVEHEKGKFACR